MWGEEFRDRSFDSTPRRIGPDGRAHTVHEFWNLFGTHMEFWHMEFWDHFGFVPDLWRDAQELIVYLPIEEAPCFRETGPNVQPEDMRWAFQHESDYRRWVANGRWLTLAIFGFYGIELPYYEPSRLVAAASLDGTGSPRGVSWFPTPTHQEGRSASATREWESLLLEKAHNSGSFRSQSWTFGPIEGGPTVTPPGEAGSSAAHAAEAAAVDANAGGAAVNGAFEDANNDGGPPLEDLHEHNDAGLQAHEDGLSSDDGASVVSAAAADDHTSTTNDGVSSDADSDGEHWRTHRWDGALLEPFWEGSDNEAGEEAAGNEVAAAEHLLAASDDDGAGVLDGASRQAVALAVLDAATLPRDAQDASLPARTSCTADLESHLDLLLEQDASQMASALVAAIPEVYEAPAAPPRRPCAPPQSGTLPASF